MCCTSTAPPAPAAGRPPKGWLHYRDEGNPAREEADAHVLAQLLGGLHAKGKYAAARQLLGADSPEVRGAQKAEALGSSQRLEQFFFNLGVGSLIAHNIEYDRARSLIRPAR